MPSRTLFNTRRTKELLRRLCDLPHYLNPKPFDALGELLRRLRNLPHYLDALAAYLLIAKDV
jgi:hypothetical protein